MKIVKALAVAFLSFFLFLSLSVFGLMFTLNNTVLNPDFVVQELNKPDVYAQTEEVIREALRFQISARYQTYKDQVIDDTLADLKPWIIEQEAEVVNRGYDYLLGRSQRLDITVSLQAVRDSLKQNLTKLILASLQGQPPNVVDAALSELNRDVDRRTPPSLEFTQDKSDPRVAQSLREARQAIGYFQLAYKLLVVFTMLLIVGIILIYREVRWATRSLGITFLTCGIATYFGNLATRHFVAAEVTRSSLPVWLQPIMQRLLLDSFAPLDMYGIVLAAIGIVLLVASFVYKPRY